MGTGSAILRKNNKLNETELYRTKDILESIFNKYEYYYKVTSHEDALGKYYDIGLSDNMSNEGLVIYLYGYYNKNNHNFDWIEDSLDIFMEIESISYGSNMMLRILHEYFTFFPNDFFYTDENIVFTKNDIEKIYNSSNWESWYYSR